MFTGHAGVCAEAERGADKHVRLLRLTISLLSKGNSCINSCGLCMEHIYTWRVTWPDEKWERRKSEPLQNDPGDEINSHKSFVSVTLKHI